MKDKNLQAHRPEIFLVYDKECPACNAFSQVVNIRESVGDLRLVDARQDSQVLREITSLGLDIDQGMVLKVGEQVYFGADAVHTLALMGSRSGLFNRINYWVFKSRRASSILYPILKSCRNLLLKVLGKTKINNLKINDNDHF